MAQAGLKYSFPMGPAVRPRRWRQGPGAFKRNHTDPTIGAFPSGVQLWDEELDYKRRVTAGWIEWIKRLDLMVGGFEWFSTWTFRKNTHPESAIKAFMRLQHIINRKGYGVKYWRDKRLGMSSIVALEYQKRGVLHLHTLDGGTRDFRRMAAIDLWFSMAGIARVYPFRRNGGAEAYVVKYILKGNPWTIKGGGDLFILGPFTRGRDLDWLHREAGDALRPFYSDSNCGTDSEEHSNAGKGGI